MTSKIEDLISSETEHYEDTYYTEEPNANQGVRRNGGAAPRLLTLRLSADQYEQVAAAAKAVDLPVSTFARNGLMATVAQQHAPNVVAALEDALRQTLKPELLRV